MLTPSRGEFGAFAEHYAAEYLKSKGYVILGQNYRKAWGEIDIIARKEGIVVFLEVKANKKDLPGFEPELRVDRNKHHRMVRIARTYLSDGHFSTDQPWQLDVIAITLESNRNVFKIRHYKNIE